MIEKHLADGGNPHTHNEVKLLKCFGELDHIDSISAHDVYTLYII